MTLRCHVGFLSHARCLFCSLAVRLRSTGSLVFISKMNTAISLFLYTIEQVTPAQSRALNQPCLVLSFYDAHDIWHFMSAISMFFSFLVSKFLDVLPFTKVRNISLFLVFA
ncbi:unnamed protein product [Echinostoma caproni]|uniref:Secreted protein n=1 Tax=Echinostoma caproni TaxID=27848 RepID=A0A183AM65_9TREM|nr:unnamed protein product [Echinostoma caproni]